MNIAIIGGGLSGSTLLKTMLEHPNFSKDVAIDIYEPRDQLGTGMPYASDDKNVMLNSDPENLSVEMSNSDDFVEWLDQNYDEPRNFEGLISRPQYGKYLLERFAPYYQHPQVTHLQEKVIDIEVGENYRLKTTAGEKTYDAVFLAVGHPPYKNDYQLLGQENYIHYPYPLNKQDRKFNNDQRIGVIGSGAASIDYFRYLTQNYELEHPLTFYVRDDAFLFPRIPYEGGAYKFTMTQDWITKQLEKGFIPLETMLETIEADIKAQGVDIKEVYEQFHDYDAEIASNALETNNQHVALVQAYISKLGPSLPHLFNALNGLDQDLYLKDYHKKLFFFRNLIPTQTAINLLEHLKEGKVRLAFGLSEIIPQADGRFKVVGDEVEYADVLINGTGFENNLGKAIEQDELIRNLYNRKLIIPHRNEDFVLVEWPSCRIINQQFGVMDKMFFLGHYIKGTQHENNNAQMIIRQATFTADWFMEQR